MDKALSSEESYIGSIPISDTIFDEGISLYLFLGYYMVVFADIV